MSTLKDLIRQRDEHLAKAKSISDRALAQGRAFTTSEHESVRESLLKSQSLSGQIKQFNDLAGTREETDDLLNQIAGHPSAKSDRGARRQKISPLGLNFLKSLYGPPIKEAGVHTEHGTSQGGTGRLHLDAEGNLIERKDTPPEFRKALSSAGRRVASLYTAEGDLVFRLPEAGAPILAATQRVEIGQDQDYKFHRQTERDDLAAGFVAPTTAKPNTGFDYETVRDRYRTIAVVSNPIPTQDLGDIPSLHTQVGDELARRVLRRIEWAIVHGDSEDEAGPAGNDVFDGILNTSGVRQQEFVDTPVATLRYALGLLENDGYHPSAIALNPRDWTVIELAQDSAGNPIFAGRFQDRVDARLFGVDVHVSPLVPEGQAIIGDWQTALLAVREDVQLHWSDAGTDFTQNTVRFRAEARVGFNLLYPGGFAVADLTEV